MDLDKFKEEAFNKSKENKAFLEKLRRRKPKDMDDVEMLSERAHRYYP
ncbi:hypothetical protein [Anaerophaga thermohalophila]|nr:hypothetical protein [Anaerophaga thermohalophila]